MIDRFQIGQRNGLSFVALLITAWLTAPVDSTAVAAEVDAIGAPAPIGFADIVARVKSAVVGVRVKIEETTSSDQEQERHRLPPGSPFDRFFRQFGIPVPDIPVPSSGTALGSGFFISGDGYVVTNNHVVAHGTSFQVTTDGSKTYEAKVIGTDPQTDLALIKVNGTDFPYVRLAAETPRVGDWVLPVFQHLARWQCRTDQLRGRQGRRRRHDGDLG